MTSEIPEWTRQYYESGGGKPFLFYVVFGPVPSEFTISRSEYRCNGVPDGIDISTYGPQTHPEVVSGYREGYLWDQLSQNQSELQKNLAIQTECLVVSGDVVNDTSLNYLRDVVGLIQWLLDSGCVGVYDPQSFAWWSAADWRGTIFESDSGDSRHHVTIVTSNEPDGEWLHTRGLRKFGRPDLSVRGVLPDHRVGVIDMLNRFIEYQAFGGLIQEGEHVRLDSLPKGITCHHGGSFDDPDFNNVHVEIAWPGSADHRN